MSNLVRIMDMDTDRKEVQYRTKYKRHCVFQELWRMYGDYMITTDSKLANIFQHNGSRRHSLFICVSWGRGGVDKEWGLSSLLDYNITNDVKIVVY